ncbi:MAG: hypothetical protein H8F28_02740 [Fibrella sp.]|nr:hypothetical protein [Armatimonadota bacterium]
MQYLTSDKIGRSRSPIEQYPAKSGTEQKPTECALCDRPNTSPCRSFDVAALHNPLMVGFVDAALMP